MNAGTPVLAAHASCLPEIAAGAALLVDPFSEPAIAKALEKLYRSPELRADLVAKGFTRRLDFSWDAAAAQLYNLLKTAAAGGEKQASSHD